MRSLVRRAVVAAGAAAMLVVPAVAVLAGTPPASAGLGKPVITFVSPSPAQGVTLPGSSVQFAFTYNRTPKQTKSVTCTLSSPTTTTVSGPCTGPAPTPGGSSSGESYSSLANASYTFTVTLALTDGGTVTATRGFTVAVSSCTAGSENFSGDAVGSQPATFSGGSITGYAASGGVFAASSFPGSGFSGNVLYAGKASLDFTVTFTNPVKSLSLDAASADAYFGAPGTVTLTGYDAANNVVDSTSTSAGTATSLSISSSTANIAYFTLTEVSSPANGPLFTDMSWGC